jgi:glycosyltransferase involved in cell wall biosynthesis
MSPVKVLWLPKVLDLGGMEVLLLDLSSSPELRHVDLHVAATLSERMSLRSAFEANGVTVHDLRGRSSADPRWVIELARLLRRERFDVVHAHSPLPAAAVRVVARLADPRAATMTTEHSLRNHYHLATRFANDVTSAFDRQRWAVSHKAATSFRMGPRPVVLLHSRTSPADSTGARSKPSLLDLGVPPGREHVLCIANLRPEKGHELLLAAFSEVARRRPSAHLVLIGDGSLRPSLEADARRLGIEPNTSFLGARRDARMFLDEASMLVLASRVEGLPVVIMEAFQAGVPVVATAVGGVPEVVKHEHNGLLVAPEDPRALARAILSILEDPTKRRTLADGARASASTFDPATSARAYRDAYAAVARTRATNGSRMS